MAPLQETTDGAACRAKKCGEMLTQGMGKKAGHERLAPLPGCPFILWGFFAKYRKSFDKPPCDPIEKVNWINVFRLKVNDLKIMV